jgi:hypothetical protein
MGIYDSVHFKIECPVCKKTVDGFQTKDLGGFFNTVNYWECNNFYSSCDYCNTWIEFILKKERPIIPIEDYEMIIEPSQYKEESFIRLSDGRIVGFKPIKTNKKD